MNRTIPFYERLLSLAKHFQSTGRNTQASQTYRQLLGLRELPSNIAEETQGRLAELNLQQGQLAKARRHLSAALGYQPNHSHYHYLMGVAAESEDERRAYRHYLRSIELHPNNPDYLCDFGVLAVQMGHHGPGIKSLRRAVELAPDDADVLERVTVGLRCADRLDEAKKYLREALFRSHGDPRIRRLLNDVEFHALREAQHVEPKATPEPQDKEPVLLQFCTDVEKSDKKKKPIQRFDGPSAPNRPHLRFRNDDYRPAS